MAAPSRTPKKGFLPTSIAQLTLCSICLLLVTSILVIAGSYFWAVSPSRTPSAADWSCSTGTGRRFGLHLLKGFTPIRKLGPEDTFGTIFHHELGKHFKAQSDERQTEKLEKTLQDMQAAGIQTVVYSVSWEWAEPEEGKIRYEYLNWLADIACNTTQLKVDLIVDLLLYPAWVRNRHPGSFPQDADGRNYTARLSWFHPEANNLALRFLGNVAAHLAQSYPGCAAAIQPVYNNEYEAKYTQEYDAYQDYSAFALAAYRAWLQTRSPDLQSFNVRWGTAYKTWAEVVPPKLHSGPVSGVDFSARYWDFIMFREEAGAAVHTRACEIVKQSGLMCFFHFPEFFTVIDAMYGASMFKRIAASEHTDFLIMDSNFRTPYGTLMNPHKLRLYVAAALSYGKPVYFEAAVERFASLDLLEAGFKNALLAGAGNSGITNWITRIEMNSSLAAAMRPAPPDCKPCELVGLFLHLDSCSAYHGLQRQWERKDPLHDFVEELAERLSKNCGTDVAVYIELDRFLADMPKFSRVVFVEPLVLYNSKEFKSYIDVKAALKRIPHEVHHLPINRTAGPTFVVLQDMPGVQVSADEEIEDYETRH